MTLPSLAAIDGSHFDVAIVGGGINGASAAQQLSASGYRVLLAEQGDFADGATSRSSRLLHCGLRHLAAGSNFCSSLARPGQLLRSMTTARDDMLARDELVVSIPERLKPISFCLPIYADDCYAPWQMDAAFGVLRMMSPGGVTLDYRRYRANDLGRVPIAPWLRDPSRLRGVAVFREYLFDWPERIALDALFDARRMGARVYNYTRVEALQRSEAESRWRLALAATRRDAVSGQSSAGETAQVTAGLVLNLAGPWVDEIIRRAGAGVESKCAGVKGIHIALRLPQEFNDWGLFAYNSSGQPLYCLPADGMHYIGLTRSVFDGDAGTVVASDREIDWMIAQTNRCLPKLAITRADILFTWAGVNPLTRDAANPLGSREIRIHDLAADGLPGMLTLTGGAVMTHRRVARRLLRAVAQRLPASAPPQEPNFRATLAQADSKHDHIEGEAVDGLKVRHCARHEQPHSLADLMIRRLGAGWSSDQGLALARPVAEAAASELGWSGARVEAELLAYRRYLDSARRRPG
jgi:glycerol-3-phosphate dehydrogenase